MCSSRLLILPLCVVLLIVRLYTKKDERRRLPPGPPPTPVLGNVFGIDTRHPWKTYAQWGQEYGGIIFTRLLTQHIIVINSEDIARNLLDKRSRKYSDRPAGVRLMNEIFATDWSSIFLPYGDRWRRHRRLFHQAFHLSAAPSFRPSQSRKARELITRLASDPHDLKAHLQLFSASVVLSIVYDYDPSSLDDPVIAHLERVLGIVVKEFRPEVTALVFAFPSLRNLPAWLPGAGFKRSARIVRECLPGCIDAPFEYVKKRMATNAAAPSMVSDALLRIQDRGLSEEETAFHEKDVKEACGAAYSAAMETTYSTLMVFILAMTLYPDVQTRAQAEIDSVIGEGLQRLPDWNDRSSLPYVEAVIKETLRWHPTVPLGIPHATTDDDIYEGYFIPKGAIVMYNAWAMSQDPVKFPEPKKFKPERFLHENSHSIDQLSFAFGFGRRVCVGRHVADASLWISIVSMLAVFRFEASPGWDPGPDGVHVKWTEGITTHPVDVPFVIKRRHEDLSAEKLARLSEKAGL